MKVKRSLRLFPGTAAARKLFPAAVLAAVGTAAAMMGCHNGPVQSREIRTSEKIVDGNAERVRVEIRMPAGELGIRPGATKLLSAHFRYSEALGEPDVRYDGTSESGRLSISNTRKVVTGNLANEWKLQLSDTPVYDFHLELGAGKGEIDLSRFVLRGVEVQVGAGDMELDVSGTQKRDVDIKIQGGVGRARITLPRTMGVEAKVQKGIGGVEIKGLTQKGDLYYNDAYSEGKPVMRVTAQTGVGLVELRVAE